MGVHELFPYIRVAEGERAIDFYKAAFGAEELFRLGACGSGLRAGMVV